MDLKQIRWIRSLIAHKVLDLGFNDMEEEEMIKSILVYLTIQEFIQVRELPHMEQPISEGTGPAKSPRHY
jgi:hypothetical protein